MDYLDAPRLRSWYFGSLHYSGYRALGEPVVELWARAVDHGLVSLPPGLIGALAERLTHRPAGERDADGQRADTEGQLIELMASGRAFGHLEGEFILEGAEWSTDRLLRVIERLAHKAGNLHDPGVYFAAAEIPHALDEKTRADGEFGARTILDRIYRDAIRRWVDDNAQLDDDDLFEIEHPHLFPLPSARTLFRRMQTAARAIRRDLGGDVSLREENDEVVRLYGEPEVLPLGGFDSFTRRGSITSLVPSELAMVDDREAIDLFDYKYLENELLYYKREQGLVFRIRRRVCVSLPLTAAMEHGRNIAWLLGFCLTLLERLFAVFSKDVLGVSLCLHGHIPTELQNALEFFRHFLREGTFEEQVTILIGARIDEADANYQSWYIGVGDAPDRKPVPFSFPDLDRFSAMSEFEKGRILADQIEDIIEHMVEVAHT